MPEPLTASAPPLIEADVRGRIGDLDVEVGLRAGANPVAVIGPNGAGKTTLLLMLVGARRPVRGRIAVGGRVLFDAAEGRDLPPEARRLGYLPQGYALFPHMTAADNVAFAVGCRRPHLRRAERRARALELLERLGVAGVASRRPAALSGGERQRVALARALSADPDALLLDEPLAALDPGVRRRMRRFLADELAALSLPTVVVTHYEEDVRALGADVVAIEGGQVVQRGSADELAAAPATAFVRDFFAGAARERPAGAAPRAS